MPSDVTGGPYVHALDLARTCCLLYVIQARTRGSETLPASPLRALTRAEIERTSRPFITGGPHAAQRKSLTANNNTRARARTHTHTHTHGSVSTGCCGTSSRRRTGAAEGATRRTDCDARTPACVCREAHELEPQAPPWQHPPPHTTPLSCTACSHPPDSTSGHARTAQRFTAQLGRCCHKLHQRWH